MYRKKELNSEKQGKILIKKNTLLIIDQNEKMNQIYCMYILYVQIYIYKSIKFVQKQGK